MQFLTDWFKRDLNEPKKLKERKVIAQDQKTLLTEAIKALKDKKRKTRADKLRLQYMEAQLDQIDRFEKWQV